MAVNPLNLQHLHSVCRYLTHSPHLPLTAVKQTSKACAIRNFLFGCILYNDMMHHMASPVFPGPNQDPMPLFLWQYLLGVHCSYLDSKVCGEGTVRVKTATASIMSWAVDAVNLAPGDWLLTSAQSWQRQQVVAHAAAQMSTGDISFTRNQLSISARQTASSSWLTFLSCGWQCESWPILHKWQPQDELAPWLVAWRQSKGPKEETNEAINTGLTTLHWHQFIWQPRTRGHAGLQWPACAFQDAMWWCSIGCSQDDRMYRAT